MLIEQTFPQIVAAKSTLASCLMQEANTAQVSSQEADELAFGGPTRIACL